MKVGTLALRVTIGSYFVGHGTQKLFGAFGGHGLKGTAQFFDTLGLKPGMVQATAAGVAETSGGLGLLLGYHTPLAASGVVATMTTAIQKVHGKNGWDMQKSGFEYQSVLIAAAVAIAETGPGFLSLDALRGKQHKGIAWAGFALGAGVGGALGAQAAASYFGGASTLDTGVEAPAPAVVPEPEPEPMSAQATIEDALPEAPADPIPVETLVDLPASEEPPIEPVSPDAPIEPGI